MLSALINKPVKKNLALTGEVTLSGDIFPIGGLNEKLLAARRAGISNIIIPSKNAKEITELPKELLEGLKLMPVSRVDEAIEIAFNGKARAVSGNGKHKKRKR